jgi:hypothetical protein
MILLVFYVYPILTTIGSIVVCKDPLTIEIFGVGKNPMIFCDLFLEFSVCCRLQFVKSICTLKVLYPNPTLLH